MVVHRGYLFHTGWDCHGRRLQASPESPNQGRWLSDLLSFVGVRQYGYTESIYETTAGVVSSDPCERVCSNVPRRPLSSHQFPCLRELRLGYTRLRLRPLCGDCPLGAARSVDGTGSSTGFARGKSSLSGPSAATAIDARFLAMTWNGFCQKPHCS